MDKKLSQGYEKAPVIVRMLTAGCAACSADVITFPFDTIKVRAQLQGEGAKTSKKGLATIISTIMREEGVGALYNGLTAGLQRQMAFASIRLGIYDIVKDFYYRLFGIDAMTINVPVRTLAGITSACIAVACAQPTDVVKIRFQGAARTGKRRYANSRQAYKEILAQAGVKGLWQGVVANMTRNAICNVTEVVAYDVIKDFILSLGIMSDGTPLHFATGLCSGIFTTVAVSPVDVVKTRYMNATAGIYKNAWDCAVKTAKQEGFLAFYKGFSPNCARMISWNLSMWIIYERFRIIVAQIYKDK